AEGAVDRAEIPGLDAGDEGLDDEQADQAEEHARPDEASAVHDEGHQQRGRQGTLRDNLADRGRDGEDQRLPAPRMGIERQDVEDEQRPGDADPDPYRLFARSPDGADAPSPPGRGGR